MSEDLDQLLAAGDQLADHWDAGHLADDQEATGGLRGGQQLVLIDGCREMWANSQFRLRRVPR